MVSRAGGNGGGGNSFQTSNSLPSGPGNNKALEAQQRASKESDSNDAALIELQSKENLKKRTLDTYNAVQSGKEDSNNKKMASAAQNVKGISF